MIKLEWRHKKIPQGLFDKGKVLDIGCGRQKLPGAFGIDAIAHPGVDQVVDLEKTLPFDDNSFDAIYANQVLEHIRDLVPLMFEIHRILKPGGVFLAHTPYFRSSWAHIDPTHVRCFNVSTMDYFVKGTYCHEHYRFGDASFSKVDVFLDHSLPSSPVHGLLSNLAIRYPFRYENSRLSTGYIFQEISYLLTK